MSYAVIMLNVDQHNKNVKQRKSTVKGTFCNNQQKKQTQKNEPKENRMENGIMVSWFLFV